MQQSIADLSLRGLKGAIDGLIRLRNTIQQSSAFTLNQRMDNFAQPNFEYLVYLQLKREFFDKKSEESKSNSQSPLSLYSQLAVSISFRYLDLKTYQKKIGRNRGAAPQPDQNGQHTQTLERMAIEIIENSFTSPKYPDLPKVDPDSPEATKCPFCGRPISEMDLEDWQ